MAAVGQRVDVAVHRDPAPRIDFAEEGEAEIPGASRLHPHLGLGVTPFEPSSGLHEIFPGRKRERRPALAGVDDAGADRHLVLRTRLQRDERAVGPRHGEPARQRRSAGRIGDDDVHPSAREPFPARRPDQGDGTDDDVIRVFRRLEAQEVLPLAQRTRRNLEEVLEQGLVGRERAELAVIEKDAPIPLHAFLTNRQKPHLRVDGGGERLLKTWSRDRPRIVVSPFARRLRTDPYRLRLDHDPARILHRPPRAQQPGDRDEQDEQGDDKSDAVPHSPTF